MGKKHPLRRAKTSPPKSTLPPFSDEAGSWPITRTWTVETGEDRRSRVPTTELGRYRVCCLLGAAGLGKTFELRRLAEADFVAGGEVLFERLVELAQSNEGLAAKLASLTEGLTKASSVYLDAFDELMIPVPQAGLVIQTWIRNALVDSLPQMRISCRSAVWLSDVQAEFVRAYGKEACAVATLEPLTNEDVAAVAPAEGIDADEFLQAVSAARAEVLARQPLTLTMLLRIHAAHGKLPRSRVDLFAEAIELLADEREERREHRTVADVPPAELIEGAERLACYLLLSGRDAIDRGDDAAATALSRRELGRLRDGHPALDDRMLDAFRRSALSDGANSRQFAFSHRQLAEYLAGRRLARLLPHQAQSLLGAGGGWRSGVAGPLRETAAFAAMHSPHLAEWVTEADPEVIGLSDVADFGLRRRATLNLFELFRRRELTDEQVSYRDAIELDGFRYPDAEADLRPVLRERRSGCEDVLECVIRLVESWELVSMSNDLADLMLDPSAPLQARQAAGYVLRQIGTPDAKRRLIPLTADRPDDPDFDLKGLALECTYPYAISAPSLLTALTPPRSEFYFGSYEGFLTRLARGGFDARECRRDGLVWAKQFVGSRRDSSTCAQIARAIARGAIDELDAPGIADTLAELLLVAAESHADSPLRPPRRYESEDSQPPETPALASRVDVRRRLIDAVCKVNAKRESGEAKLWWVGRETPGLLAADDFPWLLEQAVADERAMDERKGFATLARMLPWRDTSAHVDAWLAVRTIEPIASEFPFTVVTTLDSEEARRSKREYEEIRRLERKPRTRKVKPSPAERVAQALSLCETKDHRFFVALCRELTLKEDSHLYGVERFLPATPGWQAADDATRLRIEEAAKRALERETDAPAAVRTASFRSVMLGYMSAIWLVQERDPGWLDARPDAWWEHWAWYILRELHPNMVDEPEEPKAALLGTLHRRAAASVRTEVAGLAASDVPESASLLTDLLRLLEPVEDRELDTILAGLLSAGSVAADRVGDVAEFVLVRAVGDALPACEANLTGAALNASSDHAIAAACAMLRHRLVESWGTVRDFLTRRPDLARDVLGRFAHSESRMRRDRKKNSSVADLPAPQLVELLSLLIENFPPEDWPRGGGARFYGDDDAGRDLWNRLLNHLGERADLVAVTALRAIEGRYGGRYDWLRRPRARAERAYRDANWSPLPTDVVAELLSASGKRLIRNSTDAMDGVLAAITSHESRLRHGRPDDLEDFWNRQRTGLPLPKEEERISDKVCDAIRTYFAEYAVAADREVQIFRRKLPKAAKGASGSRVDVLCTAPARGTVIDEPVRIPIEVKLSHNPESATGLNAQLVDRYVSELGTDAGLFVVAWMGTAVPKNYRPRWKTRAEAIDELRSQAAEASSTGLDIRSYVIDLSLPLAAGTANKGAGRRKASKKSSTKKAAKKTPTAAKRAAVKKKRESRKGNSNGQIEGKARKRTAGQRRPSKTRR